MNRKVDEFITSLNQLKSIPQSNQLSDQSLVKNDQFLQSIYHFLAPAPQNHSTLYSLDQTNELLRSLLKYLHTPALTQRTQQYSSSSSPSISLPLPIPIIRYQITCLPIHLQLKLLFSFKFLFNSSVLLPSDIRSSLFCLLSDYFQELTTDSEYYQNTGFDVGESYRLVYSAENRKLKSINHLISLAKQLFFHLEFPLPCQSLPNTTKPSEKEDLAGDKWHQLIHRIQQKNQVSPILVPLFNPSSSYPHISSTTSSTTPAYTKDLPPPITHKKNICALLNLSEDSYDVYVSQAKQSHTDQDKESSNLIDVGDEEEEKWRYKRRIRLSTIRSNMNRPIKRITVKKRPKKGEIFIDFEESKQHKKEEIPLVPSVISSVQDEQITSTPDNNPSINESSKESKEIDSLKSLITILSALSDPPSSLLPYTSIILSLDSLSSIKSNPSFTDYFTLLTNLSSLSSTDYSTIITSISPSLCQLDELTLLFFYRTFLTDTLTTTRASTLLSLTLPTRIHSIETSPSRIFQYYFTYLVTVHEEALWSAVLLPLITINHVLNSMTSGCLNCFLLVCKESKNPTKKIDLLMMIVETTDKIIRNNINNNKHSLNENNNQSIWSDKIIQLLSSLLTPPPVPITPNTSDLNMPTILNQQQISALVNILYLLSSTANMNTSITFAQFVGKLIDKYKTVLKEKKEELLILASNLKTAIFQKLIREKANNL